MQRVGIIGLGKMGEAIARGLVRSSRAKSIEVLASTRRPESAAELKTKLGIEVVNDNRALAKKCEVLVLCVKPHQAQQVLEDFAPALKASHLLISICASITTEQLRDWSDKRCSVVRAMPNTPCLIGEGVTALSPGSKVDAKQLESSVKLFESLGRAVVVDENLLDGVTGLSGCGPAYAYLVIEALSEAGVKVGLSRSMSTLLAAQTLMGAAKMLLERGDHPALLKDEVTTPAGCTVDGLMALEEGRLRVAFMRAVVAATRRSRELRGLKDD
jgi:pyrroline-5-carboxylate reductase